MSSSHFENFNAHFYSVYFAPRGKEELLSLGNALGQRHLNHNDKLIGIIGDAGSGKSSIINGMFPGLTLTNDDDGINAQNLAQFRDFDFSFKHAVYHIDMRFQMAFTQMFEIVDFVTKALEKGRRVVIEHFDLLFPALGRNADIIVGVGEEIIITRPSIFGPLPKDIYDIVFHSVKKRRMYHSAEDITLLCLAEIYHTEKRPSFVDIRGGFGISFPYEPYFKISHLNDLIQERLALEEDISAVDESHIQIGPDKVQCSGPRIHVRNTRDIENFRLAREFVVDGEGNYILVGLCGEGSKDINDLNKIYVEAKENV